MLTVSPNSRPEVQRRGSILKGIHACKGISNGEPYEHVPAEIAI